MPIPTLGDAVQVAASDTTNMALDCFGNLFSWTSPESYKLDTEDVRYDPNLVAQLQSPQLQTFEVLQGKEVTQVHLSSLFALLVTSPGVLWSFWLDESYESTEDPGMLGRQVGAGNSSSIVPGVVELPGDAVVARVSAGNKHSLVLSTRSQVFSFGGGNVGGGPTNQTSSTVD